MDNNCDRFKTKAGLTLFEDFQARLRDEKCKYFLYRQFDRDDNLLYVGMSMNVFKRTKGHQSSSYWFNSVKKITIEGFITKEDALIAEKKAIILERPRFNVMNNAYRKYIENELGEPYDDFTFNNIAGG